MFQLARGRKHDTTLEGVDLQPRLCEKNCITNISLLRNFFLLFSFKVSTAYLIILELCTTLCFSHYTSTIFQNLKT